MAQSKPVYVLGTGLSHDGSACLLKDGRVCVAIEKERITRVKHDGNNDSDAIRYCLEAEGITLDDVSLVVQNANFGMLERNSDWYHGPRLLNDRCPVVTISHHLAHAYSAIGTSPFEEAAVLIIDGCGSGMDDCMDLRDATVPVDPPAEIRHLYFEKDSFYRYEGGRMVPVYKDFSPLGHYLKEYPLYPWITLHSIGAVYHGASTYVFNGFDDAGKLMGLAPYGRGGVYDFPIFDLKDDRVFVRYDWLEKFVRPARSYQDFRGNFQYYADLAYWIQRETERAVLYVVKSRRKLAPEQKNLVYAGGVALNAVANRLIVTQSGFESVYLQPAAGDNGLAIGCAFYGWLEVLKRERVIHDGNTWFGKSYPNSAVDEALSRYSDAVRFERREDYITETARLLSEGKTVGWYQDGSEFGPRALGNRSILADPRRPDMRDHINARIKFREDFRPFAPSVLQEDAPVYFDCTYESPYMILVAPMRPEWYKKIPSVVHKDNSARLQTVNEAANPKYYQLLQSFKQFTGISVLINTSFNRRGMPIVETPDQALDFFLSCDLDVLVLHDVIVHKLQPSAQAARPSLQKFFNEDFKAALARQAARAAGIGGVYQLEIRGVQTWTIDLTHSEPKLIPGPTRYADTTVEIDEADFWSFQANPTVDEGMRLMSSGALRIRGNQERALNLPAILQLK